jgi:hypothetical protein
MIGPRFDFLEGRIVLFVKDKTPLNSAPEQRPLAGRFPQRQHQRHDYKQDDHHDAAAIGKVAEHFLVQQRAEDVPPQQAALSGGLTRHNETKTDQSADAAERCHRDDQQRPIAGQAAELAMAQREQARDADSAQKQAGDRAQGEST